ncbi:MAG: ATP-binding domain-containing protein [Saprospiraceae bacterium]|nr:ATP-binding domain-containing protein [Saprospiraceae bacterium]
MLSDRATYTSFPPLKINCRNTKEIATQNTLLTGVDIPEFKSKNYSGNNVVCKYPQKAARLKALHEILQNIQKREIPLDKVTLLSSKRFENSFASDDAYVNSLFTKGLITSTIQAYKGLENVIIILFDVDDVASEQMQRLLYIGISRAKQELYLILDKSLEASVSKLIQQNFIKLQ